MNKRLRKKKQIGEFTEWGCGVDIRLSRQDGLDEFIDLFITDAVEPNGCTVGGGGKDDHLRMYITLGRKADDIEGRLARIRAWLDARPDVAGYEVGKLTKDCQVSWDVDRPTT